MRLFPKIGRDFIYREDLEELLGLLNSLIGLVDGPGVGDTKARLRALEYKLLLESGQTSDHVKDDLIDLDDDD